MLYKNDWESTKTKWRNYWKRSNTGRPLMHLVAARDDMAGKENKKIPNSNDMYDKYLNAEKIVNRYRNFCETHEFLAESFPNLSVDFGPGSLAAYLGCDIIFSPNTVWYEPFVSAWSKLGKLEFDPQNQWFKKHTCCNNEDKRIKRHFSGW
jgi:hypothetical protein